MTTRTQFPRKIRVIHHAPITLSDGIILSAMIWLPEDAEANPVPEFWNICPTANVTEPVNATP